MMAYLSRVKRIMKAEAGEVKEREIKIGLIVYYKEKRKKLIKRLIEQNS